MSEHARELQSVESSLGRMLSIAIACNVREKTSPEDKSPARIVCFGDSDVSIEADLTGHSSTGRAYLQVTFRDKAGCLEAHIKINNCSYSINGLPQALIRNLQKRLDTIKQRRALSPRIFQPAQADNPVAADTHQATQSPR